MRVGPRKRTVRYVEEAGGTRLRVVQRRWCSTPDGFVGAVENLCIIRANSQEGEPWRPKRVTLFKSKVRSRIT